MRPVGELALDLGTASTRVLVRGGGIVIDEESIAARDTRKGNIVAIGEHAREMVASDDRLTIVYPVVGGAVADQRTAQDFLAMLFRKLGPVTSGRFDVLATVSSIATPVERRAIREAVRHAGAARVQLIEKAVASALGAGIAVHDPAVNLVVDLGAGTTEVALMTLGSVVASSAVRNGSSSVDESLRTSLRHHYGMRITNAAAERMKRAIDGATEDAMIEARGVLLLDGSATTAIFESSELSVHLTQQANDVIEAVKNCLVQATPEMASDVITSGMLVTGGPAMSSTILEQMVEQLSLEPRVPDQPRYAAIVGAGKCLEAMESLSGLFLSERG